MKTAKYEIHHYIHPDETLVWLLSKLIKQDIQLMASIQDLTQHIENQSSVEDGVITLMQSLSQQLKDAQSQNDPAAIQAVIDSIDANTKKLSDAVVANTPAA